MGERESKLENLETFKESFREGVAGMIEFCEGGLETLEGESLPFVPLDSQAMGIGERTFEELSKEERETVERVILEELGLSLDTLDQVKVREYTTRTAAPYPKSSVPGKIEVSVYRTSKENVFLQRLTFADGQSRWVIGPDANFQI